MVNNLSYVNDKNLLSYLNITYIKFTLFRMPCPHRHLFVDDIFIIWDILIASTDWFIPTYLQARAIKPDVAH